MKKAEVKIFEIFDPQNFFENSAKAKLSKLEPFAWSHWIQKYLFYFRYEFRPRSRPAQKNGSTCANVPKEELENLVSQQRSKSRISNSTFFR